MRKLLLPLLFLLASVWSASAAPGDWNTCMPLGAGSCTIVTDQLFKGTATLTSSGSLPANACVMGATGLLCEGSTANAFETLVTLTNPTADRTLTIPDTTGTVITTGDSGTVTGTMISDGTIVAADITNITRSIPLPLGSWVPCAGTVPGVWDASGADAEPDLVAAPAGHLAIVYDDTGGSIDTDTICNSFVVPADYASGGAFKARLTQDAATTNIETFSCAISVDGAAAGAANAGNNVSQTAVQTVTSTPVGTWAAGASIIVACSQGNASADDVVNFLAIEGQYTATQ